MENLDLLVKHEAGISKLEDDVDRINERLKFDFRRTSKLKSSVKKNKIATVISIFGLCTGLAVTIRELGKAELKIDELEKKIDSHTNVDEQTKE